MAPSAVALGQKKHNNKKKKNKNGGEEVSKKNSSKKSKRDNSNLDSAVHDLKPKDKRKKKRKLEAFSEMNGDDGVRDHSGSKKKHKKKKKAQEQHVTHRSDDEEENNAVTDERFASMREDPLFRKMRRKEKKVVIDSRFDKIFKDKNFAGSAAPVDKRGRPKKDEKGKHFLMQHYLNQETEQEEDRDIDDEMEVGDEMRFNLSQSESDQSGSSDDIDDDDDDQYSVNSDIAHYLMASHEDTPTIENETHRLAVVNLDWDHLKAVDLYVVMNSCLPKGGKILSVSVYPSEFGLKCMEIESTHGPSALLDMKPDEDNKVQDDEGKDATDVHKSTSDEDASDFDEDASEDDDEDKINNKLRTYELNKLRYYFAVVVCDSSATANHVYTTLDGTELLKTSNVFDLRFIPDSMEFNHPPRDVATEVPVNYKEPDFETRALQHSKVKLTWEDEEPERKKVLRRQFKPDQVQLDELSVYLASTDESEDEENEMDPEAKKQATREKFLSLLNSGNNSDSDSDSDKSERGDKEGDMEITFNTDLEALGKKIVEKKGKSEETVWESVLRKKKEKKKALKISQSVEDDDDDDLYDDHRGNDYEGDEDDFFMEEPTAKTVKAKSKKKGKGKGKRREEEEETGAATEAELELLLAGDEEKKKSEKKGYNMKRLKAKTKGKKESDDVEDKLPVVDVRADHRFSGFVNSHDFALDPTDPQFKRTPAYLREKLKNPKKSGKKGGKPVDDALEIPENSDHRSTEKASSQKHELSAAIRSVIKNLPKSS